MTLNPVVRRGRIGMERVGWYLKNHIRFFRIWLWDMTYEPLLPSTE